jgi:predicted DNA-binding protein
MKEKTPLSVKLEPELHKRLEESARRTGIKKYTLAILAIQAAVDAIEQNNYRLVVPIEFEVARIPSEKIASRTSYPSHREDLTQSRIEEKPDAPKKSKTA